MQNFTIGRTLPNFKKGMLRAIPDERRYANSKVNITFFASGGGAAFHKEKLHSLGSFDEIFNPFYWEDVDLSYRAWKRGWKVIYEPSCQILHPSHGIIQNSFDKRLLDRISRRNQLIFFWKNVDNKNMIIRHFLFLLLKITTCIITFKVNYLKTVIGVLSVKDFIIKFRIEKKLWQIKTDKEIMKLFEEAYL